jgi:hypothetical protein
MTQSPVNRIADHFDRRDDEEFKATLLESGPAAARRVADRTYVGVARRIGDLAEALGAEASSRSSGFSVVWKTPWTVSFAWDT